MKADNPEPATDTTNVQQAVPFFMVSNMEASLRFYVEGLGYKRTRQWIVDNKIRWCWLELGNTALMLQEYLPAKIPTNKRGEGVSVCFQCKNALAIYHDALAHGLHAPHDPSSETTCGSPSSPTPTATNSTSKAPPTSPKRPIYSDEMGLSTPTQK